MLAITPLLINCFMISMGLAFTRSANCRTVTVLGTSTTVRTFSLIRTSYIPHRAVRVPDGRASQRSCPQALRHGAAHSPGPAGRQSMPAVVIRHDRTVRRAPLVGPAVPHPGSPAALVPADREPALFASTTGGRAG